MAGRILIGRYRPKSENLVNTRVLYLGAALAIMSGGCGRTQLDDPVEVVAVADAAMGHDAGVHSDASQANDARPDTTADASSAADAGQDAGPVRRFTWIPMQARSDFYWPQGISRDGKVVVGFHGSATTYRPFRWTAESGPVDLPIAGIRTSDTDIRALGTNRDGSVIVGTAQTYTVGSPVRAFRWTAQTGTQDLGPSPAGGHISALAVSADGTVVAGDFTDASFLQYQAYRWTASTGIVPISAQGATAVDADGSVIVGTTNGVGSDMPFRWTAATGVVTFGTIHEGATAVNPDGSIVVGGSDFGDDWHAFRWTDASGIVELGEPPGFVISHATGVSADGSVVVGSVSGPAGLMAAVWTSDGPQRIDAVLQAAGADTAGSVFDGAVGVSDDGKVTTGSGRDANRAYGFWVARLP
jgi:probable HAF family extracellular repeat protein